MIEGIKAVDGDLTRLNGDIPSDLKERYCTAFDHDQFKLIENAAAKQKWIDMGQSLNLFNKETSLKYLNDLYFHARNNGLKSTYYLRNRSASEIEKSTQATSDTGDSDSSNTNDNPTSVKACSVLDPTCESCQ